MIKVTEERANALIRYEILALPGAENHTGNPSLPGSEAVAYIPILTSP
jgi:hypothetical protein